MRKAARAEPTSREISSFSMPVIWIQGWMLTGRWESTENTKDGDLPWMASVSNDALLNTGRVAPG
tara:strand:- start:530 stop:724 length:195 start_codon:yes stop_codon:yes gene_type:complete